MNDDLPENEKAINAILTRVCGELREHCESVRIFVTYAADNGTRDTEDATIGAGNYYAQIGQIRLFLIAQEERCRHSMRNIIEDNLGEDGDGE